jgi:hypothetical protein
MAFISFGSLLGSAALPRLTSCLPLRACRVFCSAVAQRPVKFPCEGGFRERFIAGPGRRLIGGDYAEMGAQHGESLGPDRPGNPKWSAADRLSRGIHFRVSEGD